MKWLRIYTQPMKRNFNNNFKVKLWDVSSSYHIFFLYFFLFKITYTQNTRHHICKGFRQRFFFCQHCSIVYGWLQTWISSNTRAEWITTVAPWTATDWHMISNDAVGIDTALSNAWILTIAISTVQMAWTFNMIETFASNTAC